MKSREENNDALTILPNHHKFYFNDKIEDAQN